MSPTSLLFFFSTAPPTTEIYTLSLHDALPISTIEVPITTLKSFLMRLSLPPHDGGKQWPRKWRKDRKSTRLNSSHLGISYAVFCLKKKKKQNYTKLTSKYISTVPCRTKTCHAK